jgi:hypothetical protein
MKRSIKFQPLRIFGLVTILSIAVPTTIYPQADQIDAAKQIAEGFLRTSDRGDVQATYQLIGEQWTRMQPRAEILAGIAKWFNAKGGAGTSRELVMQRTLTEEQAHAINPSGTLKGNLYVFRYRTKYPNGTFFEDIYVGKDSDGVLRVEGDVPQPA